MPNVEPFLISYVEGGNGERVIATSRARDPGSSLDAPIGGFFLCGSLSAIKVSRQRASEGLTIQLGFSFTVRQSMDGARQ